MLDDFEKSLIFIRIRNLEMVYQLGMCIICSTSKFGVHGGNRAVEHTHDDHTWAQGVGEGGSTWLEPLFLHPLGTLFHPLCSDIPPPPPSGN